jgi:hypothetical protein
MTLWSGRRELDGWRTVGAKLVKTEGVDESILTQQRQRLSAYLNSSSSSASASSLTSARPLYQTQHVRDLLALSASVDLRAVTLRGSQLIAGLDRSIQNCIQVLTAPACPLPISLRLLQVRFLISSSVKLAFDVEPKLTNWIMLFLELFLSQFVSSALAAVPSTPVSPTTSLPMLTLDPLDPTADALRPFAVSVRPAFALDTLRMLEPLYRHLLLLHKRESAHVRQVQPATSLGAVARQPSAAVIADAQGLLALKLLQSMNSSNFDNRITV